MNPGDKVKCISVRGPHTTWASAFIGQVGTIIRRCPLYRGAWIVKFGGFSASLYPAELEAVADE